MRSLHKAKPTPELPPVTNTFLDISYKYLAQVDFKCISLSFSYCDEGSSCNIDQYYMVALCTLSILNTTSATRDISAVDSPGGARSNS